MCRPLRDRTPFRVHLITIRTIDARIWMVPSLTLNAILGGIIARYQEKFKIEIFAYVVLGNHIHILVMATGSNLDEFAQCVAREFAKRVNRHFNRTGPLWEKRYDDLVVIEEIDAMAGLIYITTNPVKHGLVSSPALWPGLGCYQHIVSGKDQEFKFTHYSKRDSDGNPTQTTHMLKLSPLPGCSDMTQEEYKAEVLKEIDQRTLQLQQERRANGQGFLGVEAILRQKPGSLPKQIARSPRPPCYTGSHIARKEFKISEKERRAAYKEASFKYRLGMLEVEFPEHCYKPPLHRKPRLEPFVDASL